MSQIEVDKIIPQSGTNTQLGESGDTITVPSGATLDASNATTTLPANIVTTDGTQTLTNKSIASSQITGTIGTSQIADDAVTLAKMAPGTDGNIISYDASGNPVAVATGNAGEVLTSAGAGAPPTFAAVESGTSWQSSIKTSDFTAVSGEGYWINTTGGAVTMTLPGSASVGDTIEFVDYLRTWGSNAVNINQNSLNYQGNSSPNPQYNTDGQHVRIVYSGATQGWIPTVDDDVTFETPQNYSATMLVIAGGGAGGYQSSGGNVTGGGGAGGFRTSTQTLNGATTYTITVGGGGAGGTSSYNGSDSSISGSGLTTIT